MSPISSNGFTGDVRRVKREKDVQKRIIHALCIPFYTVRKTKKIQNFVDSLSKNLITLLVVVTEISSSRAV